MSASPPGLLHRPLALAGLVLTGLVGGIALLEVAARGYDAYRAGSTVFDARPEWGWWHRPHAAMEHVGFDDEFRVAVRINGQGLRDVEHAYDTPPGTFRILVLGDSYMEALQVPLEETFGRRLEALLTTPSRPVEVINAGHSSFGTDNELLYFRAEGRRYRPDLVLLAFTTGNDPRENLHDLDRGSPSYVPKPYFTLDGDRLVAHPTPAFPFLPSAIGRLVVQRWERLTQRDAMGQRWDGLPDGVPHVPVDALVYHPNPPPGVEQAWRVTEALVRTLRDDVTGTGARFAVMLVNTPWAHDASRWAFLLRDALDATRDWDPRYPNRRLGAWLAAERIPALDLFDTFESMKDFLPLFFAVDPHWTGAGHRVAADAAAGFLRARGLVPQ